MTTPANTTVRLQSWNGHNPLSPCTESCDLRCPNFLGATQDDHHHTLYEWDVAPSSILVTEAIRLGPIVNKLLAGIITAQEAKLHLPDSNPFVMLVTNALGMTLADLFGVRLRVCVLDKIAPPGDICP